MKRIYVSHIVKNWTDYEFEHHNMDAYESMLDAKDGLCVDLEEYLLSKDKVFDTSNIEWIEYEDCAKLNYNGEEVGNIYSMPLYENYLHKF